MRPRRNQPIFFGRPKMEGLDENIPAKRKLFSEEQTAQANEFVDAANTTEEEPLT